MQYNKNKIIFIAVVGVLSVLILFMLLLINKGNKAPNTQTQTNVDTSAFNIWMVSETAMDARAIVSAFKEAYPSYAQKTVNVSVFDDYESYSYALASAFAANVGPDVFMLNNNEKSVFAAQVSGLLPDVVKPVDFRRVFKPVFARDLILTLDDGTEFVSGIPVGYEALGIFYFRRYVTNADSVATFSALNSKIIELRKTNSRILPIALGNGSTVDYAADIITQMLLLDPEATLDIAKLDTGTMKDVLSAYLAYGLEDSENQYNNYYSELKTNQKTGVYMLAKNNAAMLIGYPRILQEIDSELSAREKNSFANFLAAQPFPRFTPGVGKTFINYDYFVINKETKHLPIATDFMLFMASEPGARSYLSADSYKLPALVSLEADLDTSKVHPDYNVMLSDFIIPSAELSSFNKGVKNIYDKELTAILDLGQGYDTALRSFKERLSCVTMKAVNLQQLSASCVR